MTKTKIVMLMSQTTGEHFVAERLPSDRWLLSPPLDSAQQADIRQALRTDEPITIDGEIVDDLPAGLVVGEVR